MLQKGEENLEDRPFRSVSLSSDLIDEVETVIKAEKDKVGEALLPADFKSVAAFIAESTRLRVQTLKAKGA